jgi:hypothetical protein
MKRSLLFIFGVAFLMSTSNAQTLGVYTENTGITMSTYTVTIGTYQLIAAEVSNNVYEGTTSLEISNVDKTTGKVYLGVASGEETDVTAYVPSGFLNFAIKTNTTAAFIVEFKQGAANARINFNGVADPYGFTRNGNWQMISIPLADFDAVKPEGWDWTRLREFFTIRMVENAEAPAFSIFVDHIYFSLTAPVSNGNSIEKTSEISIYPNPVADYLVINSKKNVSGKIYNNSGQNVMSFEQSKTVDVSSLKAGLYFISIDSDGSTYNQKFLKVQ